MGFVKSNKVLKSDLNSHIPDFAHKKFGLLELNGVKEI